MSSPVYSMTGYATLRIDAAEDTSFLFTLKSVNHRFLDLQLRLPQSCDALEAPIRRLLKEQIQRGHVDRKSTRLNSSHSEISRMPSSA